MSKRARSSGITRRTFAKLAGGGAVAAGVGGPIAVVYNLFLDRFIAGFTVGSVK